MIELSDLQLKKINKLLEMLETKAVKRIAYERKYDNYSL